MTIRSVVLDVGETLIDESRIWWRWAIRLGVTPMTLMGALGAMAATNGSYRAAFELVRPDFDFAAELAAWEKDDPDGLRENFDADDLYPDVRSSLAAMRDAGYQVVIAGNQPIQAYAQLAAMDLPNDGIYTSAGWGVSKPDPEFFTKVLAVTGHAPEEILYVGDRVDNDVLPALAAGMKTALLRRGPWGFLHARRDDAAKADMIIDSLSELVERLRR
ncbi:HAD family hydrolase [Herbidospora mongoliensis]|uniref:HAD family hydrolase n=1 Tax=Herbidospora mongoliensis TaxID=688067 RepID=UPI0008323DFD|nr:HAD family hydrolase [Herbidospora mongoliensis]